jgi:uncharacterized RDD family membrane protein YckC
MSDPGVPPPYGQNPYPPNPYGQPLPQPGPVYPYASWGRRVSGTLIDMLLAGFTSLPGLIVLGIGIQMGVQDLESTTDANGVTEYSGDWNSSGTPMVIIGSLLMLLPVLFTIWNYYIRQGRTGRTIGKGVVDIKLIGEASGAPIGAWMAFVRQLCHIADSILYIGYLWPLWDPKRQTFADKIMSTVVINDPAPIGP